MKQDLFSDTLKSFRLAIETGNLVWFFGAGISASLTGKIYSWMQWVQDGISHINNTDLASSLERSLLSDDSADNLVNIVGKVIDCLKTEGGYSDWMNTAFNSAAIVNDALVSTLKKMIVAQDVIATTNYDSLLEQAIGLKCYTYQDAGKVYEMLDNKRSTHILHIHGAYKPESKIDNIIASEEQYNKVLTDEGAQFVQHVLGTRTVIFVGCGQTTDDVNISRFIAFAKDKLNMDRDYFYLYKAGQTLVELPKNVHPVEFGDEYSDLTDFLADIVQLRLRTIISRNRIVGRTIYRKSTVVTDPLLSYHYAQQAIPFCGREEELGKLFKFLDNDAPFYWWAVTGQAGAGKSRLTLETLNRLPATWFGFFLKDRILKVGDDFKPFADTLIIIDYVCGREPIIADIIEELFQKFSSTDYKLRILLIERENSRENGSWYSKLNQFSNYSSIPAYEYSDQFLNLQDLQPNDVCTFISKVCKKFELPEDPLRDEVLRDAYGSKFECLQFRPLFVQIFVEAWIQNDFSYPHYDSFEDLLKWALKREQARWLNILDNNQSCCNALIRLIVRANISGELKEDNSDAIYADDWKIINDFIAGNSFPGKQGESVAVETLAALCQNIGSHDKTIAPMYPDILKEYMFFYYMDAIRLPSVMREIWKNIPNDFSTFITRCLSDFPDNKFYSQALNSLQPDTDDIMVLKGRIELLRNEYLRKKADTNVVMNLILNEFDFWKHIQISGNGTKNDVIFAVAKITGLSFVAELVGAYSDTNLSFYMSVVNEIIDITSGPIAEAIKVQVLSNEVQRCALSNHYKESEIIKSKIDRLLNKRSDMSSLDNLRNLEVLSTGISNDIIFSSNFQKAIFKLKKMVSVCDENDEYSVYWPLSAAARIEQLAFQLNNPRYFGKAHEVVMDLARRHPDYYPVKLIDAAFEITELHVRLFVKHENKASLKISLMQLEEKIRDIHIDFEKDEFDNYNDTVWGAYHILKLNFIVSEDEVNEMISEADMILKKHPKCVCVIQAKIQAVTMLHRQIRHDDISKEEVNDAYRHVLDNVESEGIRDVFDNMLDSSTERNNKVNYRNQDIISNAIHDALYNPLNDSGISEIDDLFCDYPDVPYQRDRVKIGRNAPCPCGSGKKFKKCCIGKGIYD